MAKLDEIEKQLAQLREARDAEEARLEALLESMLRPAQALRRLTELVEDVTITDRANEGGGSRDKIDTRLRRVRDVILQMNVDALSKWNEAVATFMRAPDIDGMAQSKCLACSDTGITTEPYNSALSARAGLYCRHGKTR